MGGKHLIVTITQYLDGSWFALRSSVHRAQKYTTGKPPGHAAFVHV